MSNIAFKDVSFTYNTSGKNKIIDHMTGYFNSEKITVLTGPSGCGKSTVLYLAAGIYPQNTGLLENGKILVDGYEIGNLSSEMRCKFVGMMFQNPDLQFCMDTVENEILFCLGNIATLREDMVRGVDLSLEFAGIKDLKTRKLQTLSGGEKQKVMLACMVALGPSWLLLDEPFANIDEESSRYLVQKIYELHKTGVGILVVDHRLDYWAPIADEIRLMDSQNGFDEKAYQLDELSSEKLMALGITPPKGIYRDSSELENSNLEETVLKIENLTVIRESKAILKNLNIEFQRGKVYAIIGPSGSGKSTFFKAINGLYKYEGKIFLNGKNIKKNIKGNTGVIGFVTQSPQDQFVADTVEKEIEISLRNFKYDRHKYVEQILREVALWGYRNFSPYMLSQGQQRRLGVAALMAYDCEVLICDEPTYAQDRSNTISIMNGLVEKTKERKMILIFSTHDSQLALDYADIILELKEGSLYEVSKSCI